MKDEKIIMEQPSEERIAEMRALVKRFIERDQNRKPVWTHRSYTCRNCQH